jgi:hypothetical protein
MPKRPSLAVAVLAAAAILLAAYTALSLVLPGSTTSVDPSLQIVPSCSSADPPPGDVGIDPTTGCPNLVEVQASVSRVTLGDSPSVGMGLQVFPSGIYGGALVSGGFTQRSLTLQGDAIGEDEWLMPSNSITGGKEIALPVLSSAGVENFPFDRYETSWTGLVEDAVLAERAPVVTTANAITVPGFDVAIVRTPMDADQVDNSGLIVNEMGRMSYVVEIERSASTVNQTALLVITVLVGALASAYMTIAIATHRRPPSLAALAWLATFLFALIEVRRNFPGNPPLGVRIDSLFLLPVAISVIVEIAIVTGLWLARRDWDAQNLEENDPAVIGGKS